MRYWKVVHPGPNNEPIYTYYSDRDIIESYYLTWCEAMLKKRPHDLPYTCSESCIQDWVTVNWAQPWNPDIQVRKTPEVVFDEETGLWKETGNDEYRLTCGSFTNRMLVPKEESLYGGEEFEAWLLEGMRNELMEFMKESLNATNGLR